MSPTAPRRHLPILQTAPAKAPAAPSADPNAAPEEPPPWHWIPLGTVVSGVTCALLAPGAGALSARALARVYPPGSNAQQVAAIQRAHPSAAYGAELLAGAISTLALLAAVGLGGYFIGRYGSRTNARHGTLSGACTALLFWAVTGWLAPMLVMIPLAMLAGWASAKGGCAIRDRDLAG